MKVVIVAKTRMGSGACIGGLTFDGRSVRLIAPDQDVNDQFNQEYQVGDVWDLEYTEPAEITPPHVENIIVQAKTRQPPLRDLVPFIREQMPPKVGGLEVVYDGLSQATGAGALYISETTGVPKYSTFFWQCDQSLVRSDDAKRIHYRYSTADGGRTLTFVGYQEPVAEIPAGTILRVSLAHWWRPADRPDLDLRCYVQLSGWFTPPEIPSPSHQAAAKPDATSQSPPTMQPGDALLALRRVFGYDTFRPLQEDIITSVLSGEDALAVMPTGSGKSLCYQLPAMLFPGLTVVVSPLISLMEDQMLQLRELGIPVAVLNSSLTYPDYRRAVTQVREGRAKLLYTSPETLLRPETLVLLEQVRVDCLTIDEAHCISEWGHDFRPEYRQLINVRHRLPDAVCLGVTATATRRVREDIAASLGIDAVNEFIASFDRENLYIAVQAKLDTLEQTLAFLQVHKGESGIIYCATRRQVDELAGQLRENGWDALPYHAGLDTAVRRHHQRQFSQDDATIIVATIAFGMGINKSGVRFVLHVDLPENLESYYQQIGRAGRDGLRADCLLLHSNDDIRTIDHFISQQDETQQLGARQRLEAILGFVNTYGCRRRPLLAYFGESYDADNCGMCDNCSSSAKELEDLTVPAQKFLSCVKRTGEMFGVSHVIDVLRGSRSKKVLSRGHDRLSTYGIGLEFGKRQWQHLAQQLIQQGLALRDADYGSLKLTDKAYAVLRGEKVWGRLMEMPRPLEAIVPDHDPDLFQLLRKHRRVLADAAGIPSFVIFSDRTLVEMATYYPQTPERFSDLYGVGTAKLEKYADEFLPLIRDYCLERGIREKRKRLPRSRERPSG